MTAVGIEVDRGLFDKWSEWLAPEVQPFFVDDKGEWPEALGSGDVVLSPELRDTFKVWRLRDRADVVWLDEGTFMGLDHDRRRRLVRAQASRGRGAVPSVRPWADLVDVEVVRVQAGGHRFVWWPSLIGQRRESVLKRFIADEGDGARHRGAPTSTWRSCDTLLPSARELAGTFATGSGPNCFGTVMAAAGVNGAADAWMLQAPFQEWLETACVPGGNDDQAGTVLVWRDSSGLPVHAAVTIGDGLALEKAAQTWWTPRVVATVQEIKRASRAPGQRLERHRVGRLR